MLPFPKRKMRSCKWEEVSLLLFIATNGTCRILVKAGASFRENPTSRKAEGKQQASGGASQHADSSHTFSTWLLSEQPLYSPTTFVTRSSSPIPNKKAPQKVPKCTAAMTRHSQATVRACLAVIAGEGGLDLAGCANLGEDWNVVKKAYFKRVLVAHPDKGGDAEEFRNIQTSFEVLRDLYDGQRISSFAASVDHSTSKAFEDLWKDFEGAAPPSWDFYAEAAEEPVPLYRVELAKSGRSACNAKGAAKKCEESSISKDDIRVGWINPESGSYGRWVHLDCWRVPSRIWLGLPDPEECTDTSQFESALLRMNEVTFCGFSELDEQNKKKILAYIMDKGNWARITKRSTGSQEAAAATTTSSSSSPPAAAVHKTPSSSAEIVSASRQFFEVPVPGRNGAMPSALAGKTCVLTGVFPEVGGGKGLSLGKDRVKRMIECETAVIVISYS
jgi:hypothetical protein